MHDNNPKTIKLSYPYSYHGFNWKKQGNQRGPMKNT